MKIAVFVGTFNPFTIGHAAIVRRALGLFDHLIIGIGVNEQKTPEADIEARREAIARVYEAEPRVEVMTYTDLTVDFAARVGADCIVKGVRGVRDFEYERDQADANRRLSGIETVLLVAEPELSAVSSTLVRELQKHGKPINQYLPKP